MDVYFPRLRMGGGDGNVAAEEMMGDGAERDDVEVASDSRVIVVSLACQGGIAGCNDVGMVEGDDQRDGAAPAEAASTFRLSAPLQTIDRLASYFRGHQDQI